jgi:hypothetical protein
MMSRGYVYVHVYCCDRVGQIRESGSLRREEWGEGMAILRFQGGSSHLCRLRTASVWPRWTSFDLYWLHIEFMGPGKPSSPVTTLSNHPSQLWGGSLERARSSPGRRSGRTIAGGQDFIPEKGAQFRLSRDFTYGCCTWDPRGQAYDVLVMFFHCRVYTDLNCRDTLGYEWPLVIAVIS